MHSAASFKSNQLHNPLVLAELYWLHNPTGTNGMKIPFACSSLNKSLQSFQNNKTSITSFNQLKISRWITISLKTLMLVEQDAPEVNIKQPTSTVLRHQTFIISPKDQCNYLSSTPHHSLIVSLLRAVFLGTANS